MIKCNTNYYNTITKEEPYLEIVLLDIIIIVLCSNGVEDVTIKCLFHTLL